MRDIYARHTIMRPTKLRGKIEAIQANTKEHQASQQSIQAVPKGECVSAGNQFNQEIEMANRKQYYKMFKNRCNSIWTINVIYYFKKRYGK